MVNPFFGFGAGGYGLYMLFALPALLLGFWAQFRVQSALKKYSKVRNASGLSGAEVARRILSLHGLNDVKVEQTQGFLSDHYDPVSRTLRLSPDVYQGISVASAGIAAHETGHALQHADAYLLLQIRSAIVPTVQIGPSGASPTPGFITGRAEEVAEQILAGTPAGVNQLQIAVRAGSCAEHCDQLEQFAAEVAPLLATI